MLKLSFPCTVVLTEYEDFLAHAAKQGEDNLRMAKMIADRGTIRLYGIGYSENEVPLYSTGLKFNDQEIGLTQEELSFFTLRSRGL